MGGNIRHEKVDRHFVESSFVICLTGEDLTLLVRIESGDDRVKSYIDGQDVAPGSVFCQ